MARRHWGGMLNKFYNYIDGDRILESGTQEERTAKRIYYYKLYLSRYEKAKSWEIASLQKKAAALK